MDNKEYPENMNKFSVTATQFTKRFGTYRNKAQLSPVEVTSHDRIAGYFISAEVFEEYERLKALKAKAFYAQELSAELVELIANSKMDPKRINSE